jgi:hypothetical protein
MNAEGFPSELEVQEIEKLTQANNRIIKSKLFFMETLKL